MFNFSAEAGFFGQPFSTLFCVVLALGVAGEQDAKFLACFFFFGSGGQEG